MTSAQHKTDFWTLTIASARAALHLYFDPLYRIGTWIAGLYSLRPNRARAELQDQDITARTDQRYETAALDEGRAHVGDLNSSYTEHACESLIRMQKPDGYWSGEVTTDSGA